MASWNNDEVGINISLTENDSPITCRIVELDTDWFGMCYYEYNNGTIINADIQINKYTLPNLPKSKKNTIAHEIGHVLGLNDNPPINDEDCSVMTQGMNFHPVKPFDFYNVKFIYH